VRVVFRVRVRLTPPRVRLQSECSLLTRRMSVTEGQIRMGEFLLCVYKSDGVLDGVPRGVRITLFTDPLLVMTRFGIRKVTTAPLQICGESRRGAANDADSSAGVTCILLQR